MPGNCHKLEFRKEFIASTNFGHNSDNPKDFIFILKKNLRLESYIIFNFETLIMPHPLFMYIFLSKNQIDYK